MKRGKGKGKGEKRKGKGATESTGNVKRRGGLGFRV